MSREASRASSPARTRRSTSISACSAPAPTAITSCARCSRPSSCTTRSSARAGPGPFALKCRTPGVPLDESNLVWKAAARLWTALGRAGDPTDTVVTHRQDDPGAGRARRRQRRRGGGAAGAGAAVGRRADQRSCARSASGLGADVPFFLSGGTALGLGRGEEIYPLVDLPPHAVVDRPAAVRRVDGRGLRLVRRGSGGGPEGDRASSSCCRCPGRRRAAQMINDLEPPVVRRHPEIGALRTVLREAGAVAAAMSGSGSAVFGLFRSRARPPQGASSRCRGGGARAVADAHAEPGRVRAAVAADRCATARGRLRRHASAAGIDRQRGSVYTYRFADVHAGRALESCPQRRRRILAGTGLVDPVARRRRARLAQPPAVCARRCSQARRRPVRSRIRNG